MECVIFLIQNNDLDSETSDEFMDEYKSVHQDFYDNYLQIIESFDDDLIYSLEEAFEENDLKRVDSIHEILLNTLKELSNYLNKSGPLLNEENNKLYENFNKVFQIINIENPNTSEFNSFIAEVFLLPEVYLSTIELISHSQYNIFNKIILLPVINENIEKQSVELLTSYEKFQKILNRFLEKMVTIKNQTQTLIKNTNNKTLQITIDSTHLISNLENIEDYLDDYFITIKEKVNEIPKYDSKISYGLNLDYILIKDNVLKEYIIDNNEWIEDYKNFLEEYTNYKENYSQLLIIESIGYDFIPRINFWINDKNKHIIEYCEILEKYEKNIKKFYQQSKEKEELTEISLNKHLKNLNYLIKDINND